MTAIKYLSIGKANLMNVAAYVREAFFSALFIAFIIYIFTNIWSNIFTSQQVIDGFTIVMVMWYFLVAECLTTSMGNLYIEIGEEIISGEIAYRLNKPYDYILFHGANAMSKAIIQFLFTFALGGAIVVMIFGLPTMPLFAVPVIILCLLLAMTLNLVLNIILGLFGFWFEDTMAFGFIYQKLVFVLGGMLMPLEFFPNWISAPARFLPFSYISYHPARLFVDFSWGAFASVAAMQLAWIAALWGVAVLMYRFGIKQVSINGG